MLDGTSIGKQARVVSSLFLIPKPRVRSESYLSSHSGKEKGVRLAAENNFRFEIQPFSVFCAVETGVRGPLLAITTVSRSLLFSLLLVFAALRPSSLFFFSDSR